MVFSDRQVGCEALDQAWSELIVPRLLAAVQALEVDRDLASVVVCADGIPGGTDVWYQIEPPAGPGESPEG